MFEHPEDVGKSLGLYMYMIPKSFTSYQTLRFKSMKNKVVLSSHNVFSKYQNNGLHKRYFNKLQVSVFFHFLHQELVAAQFINPRTGGRVLPYIDYTGMCRWPGYGFQAFEFRTRYINQDNNVGNRVYNYIKLINSLIQVAINFLIDIWTRIKYA